MSDTRPLMLIVDDVEMNRAILHGIFDDEYRILEKPSGEEALEALEHEDVSIVILDIHMPGMDGFEVMRRMKGDDRFENIPIVINTGAGEAESEKKAFELGAADFIVKPYDADVVRLRISNVMAKRTLEKLRLEQELQEVRGRLRSLTDSVPGGIAIYRVTDPLTIVYYNDMTCALTGHTREEYDRHIREEGPLFDVEPADLPGLEAVIRDAVATGGTIEYSYRVIHKDGTVRWLQLRASKFKDDEDGVPVYHAVFVDITRDKQNELAVVKALDEKRYAYRHDTLTGLYNADTFYDATASLLRANPDRRYLIVRWNIEQFKVVNELFGTQTGDSVLVAIARYLEQCFDGVGSYGRIGADNFASCVPAEGFDVDTVLAGFDATLASLEIRHRIRVNAGIFPVDDISVPIDLMCDHANLALKSIKGSYIHRHAYYDSALRDTIIQQQEIVSEMEQALAEGQFEVFLQPIFDAFSEKPVSAEALVRWRHPVKGIISPGVFIPIFERNGFITKMDHYVAELVAKNIGETIKEGGTPLPVSVNVSRLDFYDPHLADSFIELVDRYDIDPSLLKIEITESAYTDNPEQLLKVMETLQGYGFKILMDDFGSGYSSFNTLKDIPVDILKIDLKFIGTAETSSRGGNILASVIRMAKWLDMTVIAEGVETKAQLDFLRNVGCDCIQGFYFSRPLPPDEYRNLIVKAELHAAQHQDTERDLMEALDIDSLCDTNDAINLLMSEMIGGMGVCELRDETIELIRANLGFFRLVGDSPQSLFIDSRRMFKHVHPDDKAKLVDTFKHAMESRAVEEVLIRYYHADGCQIWASIKMRYLGAGHRSDLFYFVFNDVTKQQTERIAHEQEQERYKIIIEQSGMIVFDWDSETGTFVASPGFEGYELGKAILPQGGPMGQAVIRMSHPDDVSEALRALTDFREGKAFTEATLRLKKTDGNWAWCHITWTFVRGKDGELLREIGTLSDVDERVRAEKVYQRQNEIYRILTEESSELLFDYSLEYDTMTYSIKRADGMREGRIVKDYRTNWAEVLLVHPDDVDVYKEAFEQAIVKVTDGETEFRINLNGNGYRWCRAYYRSVTDDAGHVIRVIGNVTDIQDTKKLEKRAELDAVSGLFNRATTEEMIKSALEEHAMSFAFFLYDIDNFKSVNDTYGHIAGDKLIRRVSDILHANFRSDDVAGRLGGDEFVVLLRGAHKEKSVIDKAQRTLDQIGALSKEFGWSTRVSASLGIAVSMQGGSTFLSLYDAADRALYEAKESGKNRFCIADDLDGIVNASEPTA